MGTLYIGENGTPLKDILSLYNKPIATIIVRVLWKYIDGTELDDFIGACSYDGKELKPLDGDSYSLDDLYIKWEYREKLDELVVWEQGELRPFERGIQDDKIYKTI